MHQIERAEALLDRGRALLNQGKWSEAEDCFREAAGLAPLPAATNNWALARFMSGDAPGALQILAPLLASPDPLPFTRALASLAHTALGQRQQAGTLLRAAIRDFDRGLRQPGLRPHAAESAWIEYTVTIKQAAGALGEHRLVLDLHNRWPGRDLPAGAFYAGVAAFNLGRFDQAARHWGRIADRSWQRLMAAYARVADLAGQGTIPPFALEYETGGGTPAAGPATEEEARRLSERGSVRMRLLAALFEPELEQREETLAGLIRFGGDWGIALGQRLLQAARIPTSLKLAAARALIEQGVYRADEPIPMVHEGRQTKVIVRQAEVRDWDPELDAQLREAIRLRDRGDREAAYRLLSEMHARGQVYPPAMVTLANLMRERGELDAAQSALEAVHRLAPDHPAVLFNLAGLWLQRGNRQRAQQYLDRIRTEGEPAEFRERVEQLRQQLAEPPAPKYLYPLWVGDQWRLQAEEKPITPDPPLRQALKPVPVEWITAAAAACGLPPVRRRPERERLLAAALLTPARLGEVVRALPAEARAALEYLLDRGGWCKLKTLTQRFGPLDGDGFWWDQVPPPSAIGQLRARGLVFVGRAVIGMQRYKIAAVPAELRPLLREVL